MFHIRAPVPHDPLDTEPGGEAVPEESPADEGAGPVRAQPRQIRHELRHQRQARHSTLLFWCCVLLLQFSGRITRKTN
jgi:hypothetical protein